MQSFQKIAILSVTLFIISYLNVKANPMPQGTANGTLQQIWPKELVAPAADTITVTKREDVKMEVNSDADKTLQIWPKELVAPASDTVTTTKRGDDKRSLKSEVHPVADKTLPIWPKEPAAPASDTVTETKRGDDKRSLKWEVNPNAEGGMENFREIPPRQSGVNCCPE